MISVCLLCILKNWETRLCNNVLSWNLIRLRNVYYGLEVHGIIICSIPTCQWVQLYSLPYMRYWSVLFLQYQSKWADTAWRFLQYCQVLMNKLLQSWKYSIANITCINISWHWQFMQYNAVFITGYPQLMFWLSISKLCNIFLRARQ